MVLWVAKWNGVGLRWIGDGYVVVLADVCVRYQRHGLTRTEGVFGKGINLRGSDLMSMYPRGTNRYDLLCIVVLLTCGRAPREDSTCYLRF